jgi:4-hydroxy-tetrahydrodipicolinate synthase
LTAPFGELVTAMVTPFYDNGEINYSKAAELAAYLAENGSEGIVVAGTTGESPTLTDQEKLRLFRTVVDAVGGKVKVLAGTGSNDTRHSAALTEEAEKCGVDGIMLVAPYYNKPSQEGLYRHFSAIAARTDLPVMLYNVPGRTVVNMTAETTLRLAALPNVAAVKEASGDLEQIARIRAGSPPDFTIYSGDDAMTLPVLSVGGKGVVSVAAHLAGNEMRQMLRHYRLGDTMAAQQIHLRLLPLFKVIFITSNPVPVKTAMNLKGYGLGPVRLPLVEMTERELQEMTGVLTNLGYL